MLYYRDLYKVLSSSLLGPEIGQGSFASPSTPDKL